MPAAEVDLSLIVPFYNEETAVGHFFREALPVLQSLDASFEIICVNDGSTDGTLGALLEQRQRRPEIVVVDLARNFGKEAAMKAGLDHCRGRAVIPIDSDLQDPPSVIPEMVRRWREGYDVVLAQRIDRSSDAPFKRVTAAWFYWLHNKLSDIEIPHNVGDFRLMDRRVADAVAALPERHRFMRGLVAWVGFRTAAVPYTRPARPAGHSKWNAVGLWNYALEGLTSFSTIPLRMWTYLGLLVSAVSFVYAVFLVGRALLFGVDTPGYTSTIVVVLFLGGIQLIGIGLLGEYVGRAYFETKQRPIYIVRDVHR